jgi:predicted nucleic acid-binding protein
MGLVNWYFDTSVLVPAAVTRRPHNAPALAVLEELVSRKHRGFISAYSLTEVYSVLTRTPFKPPLYPSEAWQIIAEMILPHMELVPLTPKEYQEVVRTVPSAVGPGAGFMTPSTCAARKRRDAIVSTHLT